jgi:mannose-6-phosphate isomerase-like protein (cupin superfamily)
MRTYIVAALIAVSLVQSNGPMAQGQAGRQRSGGRAGAGVAAVPNAPTDKTAFWSAEDIQARWRENESLKRPSSRLFNGPTDTTTSWTTNIRIVLDNDPPLVHEGTADLWIVTAGTAVARTDGQMVGTGETASIRNAFVPNVTAGDVLYVSPGVPHHRNVKVGDILYVPPGLPHHFTDVKGFRTYLIRFDTLGAVRNQTAAR